MRADLENEMKQIAARLLAEAPPVTTDEVLRHTAQRSTSVSPIDPLIADVPLVSDVGSPRLSPRRRYAVVGTIAAASMLVVGLGFANRANESEPTAIGTSPTIPTTLEAAPSPTTTAPAVQPVGDLSWPPRLLLDDSWAMVDANERSINEGYESFTSAGMAIYVTWYRGQVQGDEFYAEQGYTEAGTTSMLGQTVTVYAAPPMFATDDIRRLVDSGQLDSDLVENEIASLDSDLAALPDGAPRFGDFIGGPILEEELAEVIDAGLIEGVTDSLEARIVWDSTSLAVQIRPLDTGSEPLLEDLVAVLAALHPVEPSEWEAALPDHVVPFAERATVISEMTTGVPVPENFSVRFLGQQELVQSRGAIADEVVKSVACAWLTQYFTASDGNNREAAQAALEAIRSIPEWPASQELAAAIENSAAADSGVIGTPNSGLLSLVVNDDGTITREESGEVLTNDFAVNLCYVDAVG